MKVYRLLPLIFILTQAKLHANDCAADSVLCETEIFDRETSTVYYDLDVGQPLDLTVDAKFGLSRFQATGMLEIEPDLRQVQPDCSEIGRTLGLEGELTCIDESQNDQMIQGFWSSDQYRCRTRSFDDGDPGRFVSTDPKCKEGIHGRHCQLSYHRYQYEQCPAHRHTVYYKTGSFENHFENDGVVKVDITVNSVESTELWALSDAPVKRVGTVTALWYSGYSWENYKLASPPVVVTDYPSDIDEEDIRTFNSSPFENHTIMSQSKFEIICDDGISVGSGTLGFNAVYKFPYKYLLESCLGGSSSSFRIVGNKPIGLPNGEIKLTFRNR